MTKEMIIADLRRKGYDASTQTAVKNGVEKEGILIKVSEKFGYIVYTDEYIREIESGAIIFDEAVQDIISVYEESKSVNFDINTLKNPEYILSHIYVGVQRESTQELVKKETYLKGIEAYLYIADEHRKFGKYTIKVTATQLQESGIALDKAWSTAWSNTKKNTKIQSLASLMIEIVGEDAANLIASDEDDFPLYVVSNTDGMYGASAIFDKDVLKEFARHHHTHSLAILPSSIHEMLIVPEGNKQDLDELSEMVKVINQSDVKPEDRLTDTAYCIEI